MRDTSFEAYIKIKDEGLLSEARWRVYDTVYNHGPISIYEVEAMYHLGQRVRRSTISARFGELERMGLIRDTGARKTSPTGHTCIVWDVTSGLPIPLEKTKTRSQIITELKHEVEGLKLNVAEIFGVLQMRQVSQ